LGRHSLIVLDDLLNALGFSFLIYLPLILLMLLLLPSQFIQTNLMVLSLHLPLPQLQLNYVSLMFQSLQMSYMLLQLLQFSQACLVL
jgi:hypothetical protein